MMLPEIVRGITLGVVQGLTEFFPVSSSGHLVLVPKLFGWADQGVAFDAILHLGTLLALLLAFRSDLFVLGRDARVRKSSTAWKTIAMIIAAAVPGLAVGYVASDLIEANFRGPIAVAVNLVFWGVVLWIADRRAATLPRKTTSVEAMTWTQAIVIGCSQIFALFPGSSRSGMTIASGLGTDMDRETAVRFSFLLSIPTIAAAGADGVLKAMHGGLGSDSIFVLAVGFVAAFVSGLFAIRFLRSYVSKHSFTPFVLYRIALAVLVVAILL